jgi:hypothetical protein
MSEISNLRLIEGWYHRMWNRWDKSAFEEIGNPGFSRSKSSRPPSPGGNGEQALAPQGVRSAYCYFWDEMSRRWSLALRRSLWGLRNESDCERTTTNNQR